MMDKLLKVINKTPTSLTLEIPSHNPFYITGKDDFYEVIVNDKVFNKVNTNVFSLFNLESATLYQITVKLPNFNASISISTLGYLVKLDVRKFGALGDGIKDDTAALQAAFMACPKGGLVVIPEGTYLVSTLFLNSDTMVEIKKGAVILGKISRYDYPILPGVTHHFSELDENEYILGSWEGNPLDTFASVITGINIKNVILYGEGTIDGNALNSDWWVNHRQLRIAYRPKTIFLNNCENIQIIGLKVQNSPSWTIHPFYSSNLLLADLKIINPPNSPNTDGINPESCQQITIIGTTFDVGDDCIALKSGKIYMAKYHHQPCEKITIRNCFMMKGHGGVVFGSESSGGINNIVIEQCYFYQTDRGIRIKTRRGRGHKAVINNMTVNNILMREVSTPFVINMFYFCDPDGKSEYVYTKEALPVTDETPSLGNFTFKNIRCEKVHITAGFFYGLPESKIEKITLENIYFNYHEKPIPGVPAMMSFLDERFKEGLYFNNVLEVNLKNVTILGQIGEKVVTHNVVSLIQK